MTTVEQRVGEGGRPGTVALEGGEGRLVFEPGERGYGLAVECRSGSGWRRVSAAGNPLVRGRSFDLRPARLEPDPAGGLRFWGEGEALAVSGRRLRYPFDGRVRFDEAAGWFRVEARVELPEAVRLQMVEGIEPEITLDMGALPPYDRGDHVWFKTNIDNPTKWNDEAQGNDFPALYYFDAYARFELMMFFDMTSMSWMGRENVARFLGYRCGFRRRYRPGPMFELGMRAEGFSGTTFPAGEQRFAYALRAGPREDAPTEAAALVDLVSACLALVPAEPRWPPGATGWEDFAERCAEELMDPQCWGSNARFPDFVLNYVNGYSPAWTEAFERKNLVIDFKAHPCIDSAVWIGYPLGLVQALRPHPRYAALLERLLGFARAFALSEDSPYHPSRRGPGASGVSGTWQHLYILEQLYAVARHQGDEALRALVRAEVDERVVPLARNIAHLFPLSFDLATLRKSGNGDGYAIGGLYAYLMLALHEDTGEAAYLEEAKVALRALLQLPVNSVSQEAFLFGLGVQAAARLHAQTGEAVYREVREYLLAQTLRMMYWYSDRTRPEYADYDTLAMFQACTPIIYPAFFENVECLARVASTLGAYPPSPGLLRVFDHARRNNFSMFPACLPPNRHTSSLKHIPFENLGVLEDEKTGWIGQEIYGCGQVFQAYLMWEALARADDRDVMVLNLDGYRDPAELAAGPLSFLVFNPEREVREVRVELVGVPGATAASAGLARDALEPIEVLEGAVRLRLEPGEAVHLEISRP